MSLSEVNEDGDEALKQECNERNKESDKSLI